MTTGRPLEEITCGPPVMEGRPGAKTKSFLISPLEKLADWQVEKDRSPELEWFNFE